MCSHWTFKQPYNKVETVEYTGCFYFNKHNETHCIMFYNAIIHVIKMMFLLPFFFSLQSFYSLAFFPYTYILLNQQLSKMNIMQQTDMMTPSESSVLMDLCVTFPAKLCTLLELEFKEVSVIQVSAIIQHNLLRKYLKADRTFDT